MAKKGYWIAHVHITDPERYKDYVAANAAPLKKYGARFLVRNGDSEVPKGGLAGRRHVVPWRELRRVWHRRRADSWRATRRAEPTPRRSPGPA